jgi:SAM-dependent methyltransferase
MPNKAAQQPTRGYGLFEPLLAKWRARQANLLIPEDLRDGKVLDIGCGSYPYFLSHTAFKEKFAVDRLPPAQTPDRISWHGLDLNAEPQLPFDDGFFSVITMLAVVEHLNPAILVQLFQEVHRTLQPGGLLIVTTPAAWSDGLLRWMACVGLVSAEEIEEHTFAYTLPLLGWYFGKANFDMNQVRFGYFECGLNLWATAQRR